MLETPSAHLLPTAFLAIMAVLLMFLIFVAGANYKQQFPSICTRPKIHIYTGHGLGTPATDIQSELTAVHGDAASSLRTIFRCVAEFISDNL